MEDFKICLASTSPRRRQILESLGVPFYVRGANTDELEANYANVESVVVENAEAKARAVVAQETHPTLVVAADTLVVFEKEVMGKPKTSVEVKEWLKRFSGRRQTVMSGLVLGSHQWGWRKAVVGTHIYFKVLPQHLIEEYIRTLEPYDKSGGYAIQGLGSLLIERIEGSYTNAMGFPLEQFLTECGLLLGKSPFTLGFANKQGV